MGDHGLNEVIQETKHGDEKRKENEVIDKRKVL
jgi:hypothetical protein